MKNYLFLLFIPFIFFSCEEDNERVVSDTNWAVREYVIKEKDWSLVGNVNQIGSYYMCEFNESYLTDFVCYSGIVCGYMYVDVGSNVLAQSSLPYIIYDMDDEGNQIWSTKFLYDFMPGSIAFYCHFNDFVTQFNPGNCKFRVTMLW